MSGSRRLLGLLALAPCALGVLSACSDDQPSGEPAGSSTTTATSTTTSSSIPDATAEEPPTGQSGEDEGLGDTLVYVADLARPDDSGRAAEPAGRVEIRPEGARTLCFDVAADGLGRAIEAVHLQPGRGDGPVVAVDPPAATTDDPATWHDVCVDVDPAVFDALATDPGRFTVDVSGGGEALVGQLRPATIFDLQLSR